jgi:Xaa-Pro aminopeptidase
MPPKHPRQVSYAVYQAATEAAGGAKPAAPAASASPRGSRKRNAAGQAKAAGAAPSAAPAAGAAPAAVVSLDSPVVAAKAIKNEAELAGMREAHLRDAVALCDFLSWLEDEVRGGVLAGAAGCGGCRGERL